MVPTHKNHFPPQTVEIETGTEKTRFQTSAFAPKGAILVSRSEKEESDEKMKLVCGDHCESTADDSAIIATATGYPQIKEESRGGQRVINAAVVPLLQVDDSNMIAMITLYPPPRDNKELNGELIKRVLAEEGIIFGVDESAIEKCDDLLIGPPFLPVSIPVAEGIRPLHGHDSYLRFEVEVGPIPGTILKNGTIDFRERKIFVAVGEGQLLATKIRATEGTAGRDIYGRVIPPSPGADIPVLISGDAAFDEQANVVSASRAGILSVVNENEIKVCSKYTVDGDVDFSVGNLQSNDSLEIKGSILPSFTVRTKGDLLVHDNIQAGTVNSLGNVVIRGGVLGNKAKVYAGGDIDIGFVEHGELNAGGSVTIRKSIYFANIVCERNMFCAPDCRIVGSFIQCGGNFTATSVGSPQAEPTTIFAGVDRRRYARYVSLRQKLKLMHAQLERLENIKGEKVAADEKYLRIRENYEAVHKKLQQSNLAQTGPDYCLFPDEMMTEEASVTILKTIYSGSIVRIGNLSKTLERDYTHSVFTINPLMKTILAREIR